MSSLHCPNSNASVKCLWMTFWLAEDTHSLFLRRMRAFDNRLHALHFHLCRTFQFTTLIIGCVFFHCCHSIRPSIFAASLLPWVPNRKSQLLRTYSSELISLIQCSSEKCAFHEVVHSVFHCESVKNFGQWVLMGRSSATMKYKTFPSKLHR